MTKRCCFNLIVIAGLLVVVNGCNLDHIIAETPEFKTYAIGWADGWQFCYDWGFDGFGGDGSINDFLQEFDMPTVGEQVWYSKLQTHKMSEYQRGAYDAFRFMMRNW